jgi:thiamine pyrophosphate-dependent acetolactate synthase large subunit-like protein
MADLTGGQLVARTLRGAGVRHVCTLCGGHILPIFDGCLTEDQRVLLVSGDGAFGLNGMELETAVRFGLPFTCIIMVEALGGRGAFITDPREIGPALTEALASDEVWCLNVVLDPEAYRKSGQGSMAV